jgi:hypothetical protein
VLYTLHPQETEALISQAAHARGPKGIAVNEQQYQVAINDEWMDNLLRYNFQSSKFFFPIYMLTRLF